MKLCSSEWEYITSKVSRFWTTEVYMTKVAAIVAFGATEIFTTYSRRLLKNGCRGYEDLPTLVETPTIRGLARLESPSTSWNNTVFVTKMFRML